MWLIQLTQHNGKARSCPRRLPAVISCESRQKQSRTPHPMQLLLACSCRFRAQLGIATFQRPRTMKSAKPAATWQATTYSSPRLQVYGGMARLTAGGSGGVMAAMTASGSGGKGETTMGGIIKELLDCAAAAQCLVKAQWTLRYDIASRSWRWQNYLQLTGAGFQAQQAVLLRNFAYQQRVLTMNDAKVQQIKSVKTHKTPKVSVYGA